MTGRSNPAVSGRASALSWLGGLLALYLIVPVVALLTRLGPSTWSGLASSQVTSALATSAGTATVSTALIALGGIPLAHLLARQRSRILELVGLAVQAPLALPPLVSGLLLLGLVGPYAPLGRLAGGRLTDSLAGIVLAQTFVAAPFLIVAARTAFARIDPAFDDVAATLGHGPLARFWRVDLPLAVPGIRAGLVLAWLRAFGEFGATVLLAYHPYSLPVLTYVRFASTGLSSTQAPVVAALLAAVAALGFSHRRGMGWIAHLARPGRGRTLLPRGNGGRLSPALGCEDGPATARRAGGGRASPGGGSLGFDLDHQVGGFRLRVAFSGAGRRVAVLGPSGAGKTLTLRLLAGLVGAPAGQVTLGDLAVGHLAAERRAIGYVPQDAGLLPHLSVWEQVALGVAADDDSVTHWISRLGLDGLEARRPDELSGGQRQRVALARAMAASPALLLLDEPFSALDAPVRAELGRDLRRLQRQSDVVSVLVTHDPAEAALLADELIVIAGGRVLQSGSVAQVMGQPASAAVARLLGMANIATGVARGGGHVRAGDVELSVSSDAPLGDGTPVAWSVRPEHVVVSPDGDHPATVVDLVDLGPWHEAQVRLDGGPELTLRAVATPGLAAGARCRVSLAPGAVVAWPVPRSPGPAWPAGQPPHAEDHPGPGLSA